MIIGIKDTKLKSFELYVQTVYQLIEEINFPDT